MAVVGRWAVRRARRRRLARVIGSVLATALGLASIGPGAIPANADEADLPLGVSITRLTPSSIDLAAADNTSDNNADNTAGAPPASQGIDADRTAMGRFQVTRKPGREPTITIAGSVTNTDDVPWWNINIYALMGSGPMTSASELRLAAASDPSVDVGTLLQDPGDFDTITSLDPGASARYRITVPWSHLPIGAADSQGVYWFGVEAYGENAAGRADGADGTARTFMPVVDTDAGADRVEVALTSSVRHAVAYRPDGSLKDAAQWRRDLRNGSLARVLERDRAAGGVPVTWLIDPAVIDAVDRLAVGNPPRQLVPDKAAATPPASVAVASDWLDQITGLGPVVFALPYGDPSMNALAAVDSDLIDVARRRSTTVMDQTGFRSRPVVAPLYGRIGTAGLTASGKDTVLLADTALVPAEDPSPTDEATPIESTANTVDGHRVLVTSTAAAAGGPAPGPRRSQIAVRQRILAEAALRLLDPDPQPLIAAIPETAGEEFFDGLRAPWIRTVTTAEITSTPAKAELAPSRTPNTAAATAARELIDLGSALQDVLTGNSVVGGELTDEALVTTSSERLDQTDPGADARASASQVRGLLDQVRIDPPESVTLASNSGRFSATVVNDLDHRVSVRIQPSASEGLRLDLPDRIEIPAKSAATVLIGVHADTSGRYNLELGLTGATGVPTGQSAVVAIRAAQVSNIIWLAIFTGIALLIGAIVVRVVRRIRTRNAR